MNKQQIKEMTVTAIQFFDNSYTVQVGDEELETIREYSANIIFDEKFVIQVSGNQDEAHMPTVPSSNECYYNDKNLQDFAEIHLDTDDMLEMLAKNDVENNFGYLEQNGE